MTDSTTIAIGSVIISLMSLAASASAVYFTWLRRGHLRMTRPTLVFLGFDTAPKLAAKISLRTLLYSTAPRGQVIESMYARLSRDGTTQTFSFWGHGETSKTMPGTGLYVGQDGVTANHHFVLSADQADYEYAAGDYKVEVFAQLVGQSASLQLSTIDLVVDSQEAAALRNRDGVLFEWQPDSGMYLGGLMDRRLVA
jgi:hypothetical protein